MRAQTSPAKLWSDAFVRSGIKNVYRYTYGTAFSGVIFIYVRQSTDIPVHVGAVFADLQLVPNLGAWHGSECKSSLPVYHISTLASSWHFSNHHTFTILQYPYFSEHTTVRQLLPQK